RRGSDTRSLATPRCVDTSTSLGLRRDARPQICRPFSRSSDRRPSGSARVWITSVRPSCTTSYSGPLPFTTTSAVTSPKTYVRLIPSPIPESLEATGAVPGRRAPPLARGACERFSACERHRGEQQIVGPSRSRRARRSLELAVQPLYVEASLEEIGLGKEPSKQRERRLDSENLDLRESAGQPSQALASARAVCNELSQ